MFRRALTGAWPPTISLCLRRPLITHRKLNIRRFAKTQLPPVPSNANMETYSIKEGIKVIERFFDLPLDYSNPEGEKIRVFARNLIPKSKAKTAKEEEELPYLVYLQGAPPAVLDMRFRSLISMIHEQGYQTLWMDPRGTGLSTHISPESLPASLTTDQAIADYLKFFRADSINDPAACMPLALETFMSSKRNYSSSTSTVASLLTKTQNDLGNLSLPGLLVFHFLSLHPTIDIMIWSSAQRRNVVWMLERAFGPHAGKPKLVWTRNQMGGRKNQTGKDLSCTIPHRGTISMWSLTSPYVDSREAAEKGNDLAATTDSLSSGAEGDNETLMAAIGILDCIKGAEDIAG
ncbi:uncharacterized protein ARMOST_01294 [Armillaria ostoyae]|uniref:AB hydrolase-1 domain-containing protein n=1 Tax=Armillaria ostoyae TaxID=47428 RepID=A0A284QNL6_ARMOS|nr:uncharacterized protein ARMOST_01294 [Armillaria ostoyae]